MNFLLSCLICLSISPPCHRYRRYHAPRGHLPPNSSLSRDWFSGPGNRLPQSRSLIPGTNVRMAASTLREGNVGAHGERQSTLLHTTDYLQPASRASPADHPLTAQPSLSLVILNYDLPPFTPSLWRQGVCLSLSYVQSMGKNALLNPCPIPCARDHIKYHEHLSTLLLTCRV